MISIRECVPNLEAIKKMHVDFITKEVNKRIDFYINLFINLEDLQLHPRRHVNTIKQNVNKGLYSSQYVPFIQFIFKNKYKFEDNKYKDLKDLNLFKIEARNFPLVINLLKNLRPKTNTIISLDLSKNNNWIHEFYRISKTKYIPITFLLNKIFDYEWFLNKAVDSEWGAYQLTKSLGLRVCSYCNRQYTFTLSKGKSKITKPELDHFLPQHSNPLLTLSFFNLIPSCTICNRDCKGKKPFNYIDYLSPYELNPKNDLIKYDYFPKSYLGSIGETDEIKVFIKTNAILSNPSLDKKIKGNIKVFEYDTIINEHKDIVQEIIRKRYISNDNYIKTLQDTFPDAKLTTEEAYRLAYGNFYNENEFNKRPLAKLTKDIAIGVGSLKLKNK